MGAARRYPPLRKGMAVSELSKVGAPLLEERDHPLRPWIVAGLVLVAVVAAAGAFYYAPLTGVGATRCPEGSELVPAPEAEDGTVGEEVCLVTHTDGGDMTFGTTLRNDGVLPITVTGLDFDAAVHDLIEVQGVRMATEARAALVPMEPFRLDGGQERYVQVDATLLPCDPTRDGRVVSLAVVPVRTTFAGVPKTAEVPLAQELSVLLADCG
jgi:hypothetical protein